MVSSVGERASTSSEATETDDENTSQGLKQRKRHGGVPAAEQQEPTHATLHHRPTTRARARRGAITLKYLIDKGVLEPGKDVLSLDYKDLRQLASLESDGRIHATVGGSTFVFESPSGFSIFIKRLVVPTRKADDGWKSVRYGAQRSTRTVIKCRSCR
ncbi:hypothetical protein ACKKBF_B10890 [Auxenochlorella protothecoides x Auxenochlorella symbiontica]